MPVNPILLQQVKAAMAAKRAFVPPQGAGAPPAGGDPAAAAGAPPMDPSMMGGAGAPPMDPAMMGGAGAPPMDPAMMGGAPPMDPAAMAAAAPPAPPASGPSADEIRALIQEEIQKATGAGGAGAEGKPKGKGAGKVDPAEMLAYMERQQKLLVNLYESLGLSLPYNILDKPSSPDEQQPPEEPAKEKDTSANVSGIPPIKPVEPIGGKQASLAEKAQAARYMLNAMRRKG